MKLVRNPLRHSGTGSGVQHRLQPESRLKCKIWTPAYAGVTEKAKSRHTRFASGESEIFFAPRRAKKEKIAGLIKEGRMIIRPLWPCWCLMAKPATGVSLFLYDWQKACMLPIAQTLQSGILVLCFLMISTFRGGKAA